MTVTLTATDCYQVARCAPRGRPHRLPSGWAAIQIGVDGRTRHTTWLLYDPATHNAANVIGTPSAELLRYLLDARCHPVTTVRQRMVYLVPRHPAASRRSPSRRSTRGRGPTTPNRGPSPDRPQEASCSP